MKSYFEKKKGQFLDWWARPPDRRERLLTSVVSFWAGLWVGAIEYIAANQLPIPLMEIVYAAFYGSVIFALLSVFTPKVMRCVSFPFVFISIGGGS